MSPNEKLLHPESNMLLKQTFSSLIDAMRYAQHKEELESKIQELEEADKRRLSALEKLQADISTLVGASQELLGKERAADLEKQISSFAIVAIDLTKRKLEEKLSAELKESQLMMRSERTKTFKSLETFLAASPFPLLDRSISLRFLDGAYAAVAKYKCVENIQFEFALDCKKSAILNGEFRLSSFEREIRVPVSLAKTWHRKDPVPDFERLDQYVLSAAEATETSFIASYAHPEKPTSINVVYSKRQSHAFLTVEYIESKKKVNITSEPALNKFLNTEQMEKSAERLWLSVLELEKYKTGLARLISDEQEVFEGEDKLDSQQFFEKSWRMLEPAIESAIRKDEKSVEAQNEEEVAKIGENGDDSPLDEEFVRQKISSLGESGRTLLASLKLPNSG